MMVVRMVCVSAGTFINGATRLKDSRGLIFKYDPARLCGLPRCILSVIIASLIRGMCSLQSKDVNFMFR